MSWLVKRRLAAVSNRLARAREELAVTEAQVGALAEEAEFGAIDAIVRDDAADRRTGADAVRHASRQEAELVRLRGEINGLVARRDELLDRLSESMRGRS